MNRQIQRIGAVFALLFVALLVNLTVIQVFQAPSIRARAGNSRVLLRDYQKKRGPIMVGTLPVAYSIPTTDQLKYLRLYGNGPMYASATGFFSMVYGATGLERIENDLLSGNDPRLFVNRLGQLIAGREPQGGTVVLTLNAKAQEVAFRALAGKVGAVAAIDPATGAILALVQSPSFDPALLSSHDPAAIRTYYDSLLKDPNQPLLNRPLVSVDPPGSTFKLVTLAAALESGNYTKDSLIPGPASLKLPQSTHVLHNWSGSPCGPNNKTTLANALNISCNTAFAWLGMQVGGDALRTQAEKFGFDSSFSVPMRTAISRFPATLDPPTTAMAAIGQFDDRATVLQMAMVGAGIANGGVVMSPYLVREVRAPDLTILQSAQPTIFSRAMTAANAATELHMMQAVVDIGTGSNAQIRGAAIAGKTGTAQTGNAAPSVAWFVGIGSVDNPRVAVAVVIEDAGGQVEISGNRLAAPIARDVIKAILGL
ncbi:MAG: penicillin-binding transpeptidase domain-containing protein [Actinomycetes bacterium]